MPDRPTVRCEVDGPVTIVTIDRPTARNAVNSPTAAALADAFRRFDADASQHVAILTGAEGTFCAGYDLKQTAAGHRGHRLESGDGPMGPTRFMLGKPVIAAVEGHAVAGGLELALWCDLRVAARDATFGVYCRRFGVPLMDLGTIRLPRLIGQSRAMDMILTGRAIDAEEAHRIGLVQRLIDGDALAQGIAYAREFSGHSLPVLGFAREAVGRALSTPLSEGLKIEADLSTLAFQTRDATEGMAAFMEKRKANFSDS